jgi:hypothetical protein
MISCRTMSKKQNWKKWKPKNLWTKQTSFFCNLPFSPCAILATWLHAEAPQKIHEKWTYNPFWAKIHYGLIRSRNLTYLVLPKTCGIWSSLVQNKKLIKYIFLLRSCPINKRTVFGLKNFLGLTLVHQNRSTHFQQSWSNLEQICIL